MVIRSIIHSSLMAGRIGGYPWLFSTQKRDRKYRDYTQIISKQAEWTTVETKE